MFSRNKLLLKNLLTRPTFYTTYVFPSSHSQFPHETAKELEAAPSSSVKNGFYWRLTTLKSSLTSLANEAVVVSGRLQESTSQGLSTASLTASLLTVPGKTARIQFYEA